MSSEREQNAVDALVTETYRDLASEKTPDHLNQAVLIKAGGKKRAAKEPLLARWMKPLTWAATIGLSLAIVLEISKLPSISDADTAMPASAIAEPRPIRDEFENAAIEAKEVIESRARLAASPMREAEDGLSAAHKKSADNQPPETVGLEKISPKRKQESFAAGTSRINSASRSAAAQAKPESGCTESTRESADNWLQCIADLRLAGQEETAEGESVLFVIQFPAEAARLEANK